MQNIFLQVRREVSWVSSTSRRQFAIVAGLLNSGAQGLAGRCVAGGDRASGGVVTHDGIKERAIKYSSKISVWEHDRLMTLSMVGVASEYVCSILFVTLLRVTHGQSENFYYRCHGSDFKSCFICRLESAVILLFNRLHWRINS